MFNIFPRSLPAVLLVIAAAIFAGASPALAEEVNAPPELGDSGAQILSKADEAAIGRQYMRELFRDRSYVNDYELEAYLNRLAANIGANAFLRGTTIKMHVVQHPALNAFALPDGHITVHTGLILSTADEGELAAVVGHEIAHVSQRHLPRLLAKSESNKLPAIAAIMAALLVGGKAGVAGLTVANAALISSQLAYTREFEREADAVGIKLLAEAGYDPYTMSRFFEKLDQHGGIGGAPEFLRSHPVSYTRIAEAESRAAAYPTPPAKPELEFYLAQAKVRALYTARNDETIKFFNAQAAQPEQSDEQKIAARYGIALAQYKMRQPEVARETLQPLLDAHPDMVAFQLARAEIDLAEGLAAESVARYARLAGAHPELSYLTHDYANALLAAGDAAEAKRVLRRQLRRNKRMFTLYPLLSKSNVQLGLLAEAHQATAEYHIALGDLRAAAASLKLALREADEEGYLHDSLSARLKQLEEVMKRAH